MRKLIALLTLTVALAAAPAANATITSVFGGDVSCTVLGSGDRFCGSDSPRSTTKTWDNVPIDVNVAFPPVPASPPDGGYPLVMIFHGYGGHKLGLTDFQPWLDKGYAVFSMSDRGMGESCGSAASRAADPADCANGFIRLMDDRYEVRDAQLFAGKLVDEGLVDPARIGATGGSYGGGMSMALAALKDRTMMPDGSLVPWTSPLGTPISLAAAAPIVPWTDLAASLTPNGSTLDYAANAPYTGRFGVMKQSFVTGLYLSGCLGGFCSTPGTDPDSDLTTWYNRELAGEPYDGDPTATSILDEVTTHHSSFYIDHSEAPAPLLISNGFTDDLFPADEAIRYYNRTNGQYPNAPLGLMFFDFGHMRGQSKPADVARLTNRIGTWFDHYVKGTGPTPFQGVETMTQTCPCTAASAGPFTAKNWASLPKGEIRFSSAASKTILPTAGDPAIGAAFDPLTGPGACASASGADQAGTATYRLKAAPSGGYTMMGAATVIADFKLPGANSQVAARLLDVDPSGQETLVDRGLWRPKVSTGFVRQVFQLHPNGWTFKKGHIAKLELLPNDFPYGRKSDGQANVTVKNLELRLPVMQKPGSFHGLVKVAAPKFLPSGTSLAKEFKSLPSPAATLGSNTFPVKNGKAKVTVKCPASFDSCNKGKIVIKSQKGATLAKGSFSMKGGKSKTSKLRLNGKGKSLLAKSSKVPVKVTLSSAEFTAKNLNGQLAGSKR